jgi:hypothetical protein
VLYSDDWGEAAGPLIRYRYPGEVEAGNCIFPKLLDGSAEVMVGIMAEDVEVSRGDECFGKYLGQR